MTVNQMRLIDRWVGVPLTFLLTLLLLPQRLFRSSSNKPDVSRTLFIELSEMGSTLLADPAMRKLQRETGAELYFAIFDKNTVSLEILNTIEKSHIFKMRNDNLFILAADVFRFVHWCRKHRITCVVDLELFSRFTALLSGLSGAKDRVGFTNYHEEGLYRGRIVTTPVRYNPHIHISRNFLALVHGCMGFHSTPYATHPINDVDLKLTFARPSDAAFESVNAKIQELYPEFSDQRIILFNANASDMLPQRRWMPERFAELAKGMLANYDDILIIATGSGSEHEYVQKVVDMADNRRFVNSCGVFKFLELIPLYYMSTMMLTNDSGPAHFAATTPLKVFVIFGPETPDLYLPIGNAEPIYLGLPCSPCVSAANHRKTTCADRPCITGISTMLVRQKLEKYLEETITKELFHRKGLSGRNLQEVG